MCISFCPQAWCPKAVKHQLIAIQYFHCRLSGMTHVVFSQFELTPVKKVLAGKLLSKCETFTCVWLPLHWGWNHGKMLVENYFYWHTLCQSVLQCCQKQSAVNENHHQHCIYQLATLLACSLEVTAFKKISTYFPKWDFYFKLSDNPDFINTCTVALFSKSYFQRGKISVDKMSYLYYA